MKTATFLINALTVSDSESEWRYAELAARIGLESDLAARYSADPGAVLDEFGLAAAPADAESLLDGEPVVQVDNLTEPDPDSVVMFTVTVAPETSPDERPLAA